MRDRESNYSDYEAEERSLRLGRGWVTWFIAALALAAALAFSGTPSGYVVERPGPVYDTLSTTEVEGDPVSLVDIPKEETFPTTGSLSMLTVVTVGDRDRTASWFTVISAWLDKSQAVLPVDQVFPAGVTTAEEAEISQAQMTQSQQSAIAAALSVLGQDYSTRVRVAAVTADGPSVDVLEAGDVITAINAEPIADLDEVRSALEQNGTELPALVSVLRDGAAQDVQVTPVDSEIGPIIGVSIATEFDFPFEVSIQLDDVGGPSAGQIFALAIIDKLTPGPLTGGRDVAGTGTISEDGTIGAIGGIRQKMYGAVNDGADFFLAPAANCDEVVGHIPDGLSVFAVSTLADSLAVLNTLSTGASTALLPRCEP